MTFRRLLNPGREGEMLLLQGEAPRRRLVVFADRRRHRDMRRIAPPVPNKETEAGCGAARYCLTSLFGPRETEYLDRVSRGAHAYRRRRIALIGTNGVASGWNACEKPGPVGHGIQHRLAARVHDVDLDVGEKIAGAASGEPDP